MTWDDPPDGNYQCSRNILCRRLGARPARWQGGTGKRYTNASFTALR